MDTDEKPKPSLWQPLTFGGVAAYAQASFIRVFVLALVFALIAAASVVWFFHSAWEPVLREAIAQLPNEGAIQGGRLEWKGPTPVRLAGGAFLSIVVDATGSGEAGSSADFQIEFSPTRFWLCSLVPCLGFKYPKNGFIALSRQELEPWWGAWQPVILAGMGAAVMTGLLAVWAFLAAVYTVPARVIAYLADRPLSPFAAWRLAVAALMPGSLFMSAAITAYGINQLTLIQLLFMSLLHLAIGWLYVLGSPLRLPRRTGSPAPPGAKNPFKPSERKLDADM
jgi:hypothetical protein